MHIYAKQDEAGQCEDIITSLKPQPKCGFNTTHDHVLRPIFSVTDEDRAEFAREQIRFLEQRRLVVIDGIDRYQFASIVPPAYPGSTGENSYSLTLILLTAQICRNDKGELLPSPFAKLLQGEKNDMAYLQYPASLHQVMVDNLASL